MATNQSTLELCKDYVLAKQFDDPLWLREDKTTSKNEWSCKEVAKWVAEIEGTTDNIGATFARNDVNGVALLIIGQEDLKDFGVIKA